MRQEGSTSTLLKRVCKIYIPQKKNSIEEIIHLLRLAYEINLSLGLLNMTQLKSATSFNKLIF